MEFVIKFNWDPEEALSKDPCEYSNYQLSVVTFEGLFLLLLDYLIFFFFVVDLQNLFH